METIEEINYQLGRDYGYLNGLVQWRVVWTQDQFEKRWTEYTDEGFQLIHPEVRELPKYRQWKPNRYVLERLVIVPAQTDMVEPYSYEPVNFFDDVNEKPIPPRFDICKIIIEQVYKQAAKAVGVKYKDPEIVDPKIAPEVRKARVEKLIEEMFPNETDTGDALAYREGIVVPKGME